MKILIKRIAKKDSYTIGKMYINDAYFCDTLEDKDRGLKQSESVEDIKKRKIYGETAIPSGTYKVTLTYSNRFKKILPLVNDVKGFDGIRIHSGNTAKDSLGCILVGYNKVKGQVINSRDTMNKLMNNYLTPTSKKKEIITLTIE